MPRTVDAQALFIFVGSAPRTEILKGVVQLDEKNFVLTGPDIPRINNVPKGWTLNRDPYLLETSVPGIFAAGDLTDILERAEGAVADVRAPDGTPGEGLVDEALETPELTPPADIPAKLPERAVPEAPAEKPVEKALDDGLY